jgi:hypothetical protein
VSNSSDNGLPTWLARTEFDSAALPDVRGTGPTISERFRTAVDNVAIFTRGKQLGVLGPRAAGKTTLHTWLRDRTVTTDYVPTLAAESTRKARQHFESNGASNGLILKKGRDVPGDRRTNFADWRKVVSESHYLLYLFDANRLVGGDRDHRREVISDCSMVGQLLYDEHGDFGGPKVVLVGTHCDQMQGYVPSSQRRQFLKFTQMIAQLEAVDDAQHQLRAARERDHRPPLVLGALNTPEIAADLSVRLMTALKG